jgi:hypothetical protein
MGLDARLSRLEEGQARLDERLASLSGDLGEIKRALAGNGQPGALQRLTKVESTTKVLWGVVSTLGAGLVTFAGRYLLLR